MARTTPAMTPKANRLWLALFLAHLILASQCCTPTAAQTKWEFVPGSRQARPVSTTSTHTAQPGYAGRQGYPAQSGAGYPTQPARSGGMQLRTRQPVNMMPAAAAPAQPRQAQQRTTAATAATAATAEKADGSATGAAKAYDFVDSLNVDGTPRTYRAHIPKGYDRSKPTPVVLAFHGLGMNSLAMLAMSGFNGLADRKGFIVVYGEGLNHRWNDGTQGGADDIGYVSAVLAKLARIANVDQRRIYACGISNGGFFTQRLVCALSDKIAAAGVVASTMIGSTSGLMSSGNRMPIILFLGTEDPILPWGDGRNKELGKLGESLGLSGLGSIDSPMVRMGGLMAVPEMIQFWTNHNGCGGSPSVTQMPNQSVKDGTTVKRETFGSGDVTLYVIEGGGHTWPGMMEVSAFTDICGTTSQDIDASEIMWDFFKRYAR